MGLIGIIVVVLIGIATIVLLSGHGGILIAGYNTASEEEKAAYDEKKLCRIIGAGFFMIEVGLIGLMIVQDLSIISVVLIFIGICIPLLFSDKYARRKEVISSVKKKNDISNFIGVVLTCVVLLIVGIVMFVGDINVEFYENDMECSGFLTASTSISYDEIESVSLEKDLDLGTRTFGVGSFSINAGNFSNEAFGDYKLYSYTSCKTYVVINIGDKIIVINDKNDRDTTNLYHTLLKYVED